MSIDKQEEKWFDTYTWNSESDTRYVMFRQRTYSVSIQKMIDRYLQGLGFTNQTEPNPVHIYNSVTIVDLSSKTYEHVTVWFSLKREREYRVEIPYAYPSQISIFIDKHFGSLAGFQYGI